MSKLERRTLTITECKWKEEKAWSTILGVVMRGNLWLDGLLKHHMPEEDNPADGIIQAVHSSPHFDQIRHIVIKGLRWGSSERKLALGAIYRQLKLPILCATEGRATSIGNALKYEDESRSWTILFRGLDKEACLQLLDSGILEGLRVATLLTSNLSKPYIAA